MPSTKLLDDFLNKLLIAEGNGEFTNDPKDSGGPTRWGITETVARENGYTGPMEQLPRQKAVDIYTERYWRQTGFSLIADVDETVAERLFQFSVVAGQETSSKHLQRVLNVLNRNGRDYPDILIDGHIGHKTVMAMWAFVAKRGTEGRMVLLGMICSLQSVYLLELAENRPKDEEYEFGWQLNRALGVYA